MDALEDGLAKQEMRSEVRQFSIFLSYLFKKYSFQVVEKRISAAENVEHEDVEMLKQLVDLEFKQENIIQKKSIFYRFPQIEKERSAREQEGSLLGDNLANRMEQCRSEIK